MSEKEQKVASSTATVSVAGGAGLALTAIVKVYSDDLGGAAVESADYIIPVLSAIIGELYRKVSIFGGQYVAEKKIERRIKRINKYLKKDELDEETRQKLTQRRNSYIVMLTDYQISLNATVS